MERLSKVRRNAIMVSGLLIIPALYLVLMWDIRSADPGKQRIYLHNQHVALAIEAYTHVYTNMPGVLTETVDDTNTLAQASEIIIRTLLGKDELRNPTGTAFMETPDASKTHPGAFKDLWSQQHLIRLDDNRDGKIPMGERSVNSPAVVWSIGPNGRNDWGRKDDIVYPR